MSKYVALFHSLSPSLKFYHPKFSMTRGRPNKEKAPTALKRIRQFAKKQMGTQDVRIDVKVNQFIWKNGIKNVPRRIRVRLTRKRNDDEDAKEKMYTLVTYVPVTDFAFLTTENVKEK